MLLCVWLPVVLLHVETRRETNIRPLHISIFSILQTLSMCIFICLAVFGENQVNVFTY